MTASLVQLHSAEASLVLELAATGAPLWRHLGARLDPGAPAPLADGRTAASFSLDQDVPLSTAPLAGLGWFGPAAVALRRGGRAVVPVFTAKVEAGAKRIAIRLTDAANGLECRERRQIDAFSGESGLGWSRTSESRADSLASLSSMPSRA